MQRMLPSGPSIPPVRQSEPTGVSFISRAGRRASSAVTRTALTATSKGDKSEGDKRTCGTAKVNDAGRLWADLPSLVKMAAELSALFQDATPLTANGPAT